MNIKTATRNALFLAILFSSGLGWSSDSFFYRIFDSERFGYMDSRGNVRIPISFDYLPHLCVKEEEGMLIPCGDRQSAGFCDKSGAMVLERKWTEVSSFVDGLTVVRNPKLAFTVCGRLGKCGVIDRTGKWVISPDYHSCFVENGVIMANEFEISLETSARYPDGRRASTVYDLKGEVLFSVEDETIVSFSDGLFLCYGGRNGSKSWYRNQDGTKAFDLEFDYAETFTNQHAVIGQGYRKGIIDTNGQYSVECSMVDMKTISCGLCAARKEYYWGFVDVNGQTVIPFQYERAGNFAKNGLAPAAIAKDYKPIYGYIDREGKFVIKPQFAYAGSFIGDMALVRKPRTDSAPAETTDTSNGPDDITGEEWAYIDISGNEVWHGADSNPKMFTASDEWDGTADLFNNR